MLPTLEKTAAEIQQDVLRELKWDTRVDETDVGVEVDGNVVTLTGTVDSWAKRMAAAEAAHRVRGVLDVANDIRVRLPGSAGRTDTEIAQAVRLAFEWDVFVPEKRIMSTVSDGVVTLTGVAESWTERDDAERAVRNLVGVRGVTNRIEVQPKKQVSPAEIRRSIEAALERHAVREAQRLDLKVEDGKVTVTGLVGSWKERDTVMGAVKGTLGVRRLEDKLQVAP